MGDERVCDREREREEIRNMKRKKVERERKAFGGSVSGAAEPHVL